MLYILDEISSWSRMTAPRKGSADKSIPHTRLENEDMIWETYEVGEKLGQGAFGKVYQVRHKSTNDEWAMKFINKEKVTVSFILLWMCGLAHKCKNVGTKMKLNCW